MPRPVNTRRMRLYAERPLRILRQLLADAVSVAWVVVLVLVALAVRALILTLQSPAQALVQAGDTISGTFDGAARTAGKVPFVGGDLATALGNGTGAGARIAQAGHDTIDTIATVATGTAVAIVLVGLLPLLVIWLPLRLRYARAAGSAVAVRDVDDDLLALRAMAGQPVRRLLRISPDPAAAWRRGDVEVVRGLAALELASLGLKGPRRKE